MKYIVRLQSLEISGFKSVAHGDIQFYPFGPNSENGKKGFVTGIYGQNGSGKSAVVEVLFFLRQMILGEPLSYDIRDYIRFGCDYFTCTANFIFFNELANSDSTENKKTVSYKFSIKRTEKGCSIKEENLVADGKKIISYNTDVENYASSFSTQQNISTIKKTDKNIFVKLQAYLSLIESFNKSFIFSEENYDLFMKVFDAESSIFDVLRILRIYMHSYFFLFKNEFSGTISTGKEFPLSFSQEVDGRHIVVTMLYKYIGNKRILKRFLPLCNDGLSSINIVLQTIIPNMQIKLKELGTELNEKGEEWERIEMLSVRNENTIIPLQYESDGIKKLVSILGVLVDMYNNPKVTVIIDELDSGIFEYLLGELTKIMESNAKGMMIFTSHNLRPLELLDYKSLYFTTTNPDNRFIQLSAIKTNNNVRKVYYNELQLGGQKENLYDMVDSCIIRDAFFEAGLKQETANG